MYDNTQIYISDKENKCVQLAVKDLQQDIQSITNKKVKKPSLIMIGTLGGSKWIKKIENRLPELKDISNNNEGYLIKVIKNPEKGIDNALVIIGTDKQGTMWGVYDVCEKELGVDPMKLWTEYEHKKQEKLTLNVTSQTNYPKTPFRGIFINDEWGLLNWNSDGKGVSYKTHEIIIETLLRLKGNMYCVPMKGKTLGDKGNQLMDDRGIFQTASHHEILLAKTAYWEWNKYCMKTYGKKIPYSYISNKKEMELFFLESIQNLKKYNCIWPVGLRGAGDGPFWRKDPTAPKTMDGRAAIVAEGTQWQCDLLKKITGDNYYNNAPKTITLYGELFDLMNTGKLKVPKNVTYVWADNSNGIMRLPKEKPMGKQGVYTHITYCNNHNVQYIAPKKILHEFKRIMNLRADHYYLVNVGDLKENLLGTEYSLKLAWDGTLTNYELSETAFLSSRTKKYFPERLNNQIVNIYKDYFELADGSKKDKDRAQDIYGSNRQSGSNMLKALEKDTLTEKYFLHNFRNQEVKHLVGYNKWNILYDRAITIYNQLDDKNQKAFYRTDLLYNIQMHRLQLKWSTECSNAIKEYTRGDTKKAVKILENAKSVMEEWNKEINFIERSQYKGWYTDRAWNKAPLHWKPILSKQFNEIREKLISQMEIKK